MIRIYHLIRMLPKWKMTALDNSTLTLSFYWAGNSILPVSVGVCVCVPACLCICEYRSLCACVQLCTCLHDLQLNFDQNRFVKADSDANALVWKCWKCCCLIVSRLNLVIFLFKGLAHQLCASIPRHWRWLYFLLWCSQHWKITFEKHQWQHLYSDTVSMLF